MPDRQEVPAAGGGRAERLADRQQRHPVQGRATTRSSSPKFDAGEYVKGPDQSVPDWDNAQAGMIFEQMLTQTEDIDGCSPPTTASATRPSRC